MRPDIALIVNVLGRYLSNLGHDHWVVEKKSHEISTKNKGFYAYV